MIVAGVGCRRGATAEDVGAALLVAMAKYAGGEDIAIVATVQSKAEEPGIVEAARRLGVRLVAFPAADLDAVAARLITRSERVRRTKGVPSIAEAAALVAAGRNARLLGPRLASAAVTCALARGEGP